MPQAQATQGYRTKRAKAIRLLRLRPLQGIVRCWAWRLESYAAQGLRETRTGPESKSAESAMYNLEWMLALGDPHGVLKSVDKDPIRDKGAGIHPSVAVTSLAPMEESPPSHLIMRNHGEIAGETTMVRTVYASPHRVMLMCRDLECSVDGSILGRYENMNAFGRRKPVDKW